MYAVYCQALKESKVRHPLGLVDTEKKAEQLVRRELKRFRSVVVEWDDLFWDSSYDGVNGMTKRVGTVVRPLWYRFFIQRIDPIEAAEPQAFKSIEEVPATVAEADACPRCGRQCTLVSSDGSPVCSGRDCD